MRPHTLLHRGTQPLTGKSSALFIDTKRPREYAAQLGMLRPFNLLLFMTHCLRNLTGFGSGTNFTPVRPLPQSMPCVS